MTVQKRALAVLVAIFAVVGGVSYSASATTEPTDVTVSSEVMAVDAVDDVAKVNQESTVNVNVLGNDLGANRKVTNFTKPANGDID